MSDQPEMNPVEEIKLTEPVTTVTETAAPTTRVFICSFSLSKNYPGYRQ